MSSINPSSILSRAYPFIKDPSASTLLDLEKSIFKYLLSISDSIIEQLLLEAVSNSHFIDHVVATYKTKGYTVHSRKYKTHVQLYGGKTVHLETVYMLPKREPKRRKNNDASQPRIKGNGVYPVLKMLGFSGQASPALQNALALSAINNTFAEATENVQRHGIDVSEKRLRTVSENVGKIALEKRADELTEFKQGTLPQQNTFTGKRVVITIDGGRIRMRKNKKGKKKKGQKRKGFHTDWKEPKLFKLYAIDENGKKQDKQILPYCDGTHLGRDKFKELLKMHLHKTNVASAEQIIFINDGATWIWNIIDELTDEMKLDTHKIYKVLDFYHAAEHLWRVIDSLKGLSEKQKKRLFKSCRKQLKSGNIDTLIESLGKKAKRSQNAYKELRYFHGKEDRCRYDSFLDKNIPIGSGAIESTIRRVVNLRLKGAGMFWLQENAEAFLHLRCQLKSNRWNSFFVNTISI